MRGRVLFAIVLVSDPDRPPYRGLRPLEAEDAGIFFGREAPIVEDSISGSRCLGAADLRAL